MTRSPACKTSSLLGNTAFPSRTIAPISAPRIGMKQRIAAIVARNRAKATGVTVYHELDPTLFSLTSNTFVGRVYAMPSSVTIDSGQARWRNAAARAMSSSVPSRSTAGP